MKLPADYLNPPHISPNASSFFCCCCCAGADPPLEPQIFAPPAAAPPPTFEPQRSFAPNRSGCCGAAGAPHMFAGAGAAGAAGAPHPPEEAPQPVAPIMLVGCCCCCAGAASHGDADWKLPNALLLAEAAAGAAAGVEKRERISCFIFFDCPWPCC